MIGIDRMKYIIRKAKPSDAEGTAKSFNEGLKRGINIYTGTNFLITKPIIEQNKKLYSQHKRHFCYFVALDKDKVVGQCAFHGRERGRLRNTVSASWGVHPDYVGKGIATKMLTALIKEAKRRGMKRIEADPAVENKASIALAEKLGFKLEGRKKSAMLLDDGRYVDMLLYGKVLK